MKSHHTTPLLAALRTNYSPTTSFDHYPLSIPFIKHLDELAFSSRVTFFVGENGSGKSTLLEAIAHEAGFSPEGGSKNMHVATTSQSASALAQHLTLSWRKKPTNGYFFRAESFFNVASYLDTMAREGGQGEDVTYRPYGGTSLHAQSHGESFLSFFSNRLGSGGFFIFDEPEAALSPQRQLSLLTILHDLCTHTDSQFLIATHSPLLLAYPGAMIYSCDGDRLKTIAYKETDHYRLTKRFLDNHELYLQRLFSE